MYVSVVDQAGAPVPNLGPADFIVREDNLSREVLRVAPATDPMQIAILVDNSTAAAAKSPHIRRALPAFIEHADDTNGVRSPQRDCARHAREPPDDPRELLHRTRAADQGHRPHLGRQLQDRQLSPRRHHRSLPGLQEARGNAAGHRGNYERRARSSATASPDQVLTPLRDSGAALHVISIGLPAAGISDDVRYRDRVVDEGPRASGGTHTQLLVGLGPAREVAASGNRAHAFVPRRLRASRFAHPAGTDHRGGQADRPDGIRLAG